jgi:hypothetical protein
VIEDAAAFVDGKPDKQTLIERQVQLPTGPPLA